MKKIISIALALVLTCALAVTCFAALNATNGTGTEAKDVTVTITGGNNDTKVYGADLVWDTELAFSYGKTWSTTDLKYNDDANGRWDDNEVSVAVKNRSNATLWATVEYEVVNSAVTLEQDVEATQVLECPQATGNGTSGAPGATQTATYTVGGNLVGAQSGVVAHLNVTFAATAPVTE